MVEARFYSCSDGSLHMTAAGHAGAGTKGADLVCAGVSTLAVALGEAVQRLYEQGMLRRYPRVELEQGYAVVAAEPKKRFRREAWMVFWTVQNGVSALQEGFPDNVRLEEAMKVEREPAEKNGKEK